MLNQSEIDSIINAVYENHKVILNPEITLEANPDDLTKRKIIELSKSRINRLSIGIQSFFEDDLKKNNMLNQFYKCFDKVYYSSRMGKRKPDENCFKQVLEENQLVPQQTLFIDDSVQHIKGAKRIGIETFHLEKNKSIIDLVPDIIQSKLHQ